MKRIITLLLSSFLVCFVCCGQTISPSTPSPVCLPSTVFLSVTGGAGITAYQWIKDGGYIPSATGVDYTATASGLYKVKITTGPLASDTTIIGPVTVTINPLPVVPSFTFNTNNQCASLNFNFLIVSPVLGITYTWDFGDGNTATGVSVNHIFAAIGNLTQNYAVHVTATTVAGCSAQSANQTVTAAQKPDATLGGPNATTYNGKNYFRNCSSDPSAIFEFTNASTTSSTNINYKINWGDGLPDTSFTSFSGIIFHPYNIGTYPLIFTVTGNNGCVDSAQYFIFVGSNPAVGLGNPGNTTICTGTSLTFPISGTALNTPGTIYTVTFNDLTAPIVYNNGAPPSITHNFANGSCGTTTQTTPSYMNSFSATIEASNPCLTSAATVVPIYVSVKPAATFSVSPNDTTCVNSLTTLINTSITNNYINPPNCTSGKFVWTISPATGWSVVTGSLGSDNGSANPGSWSGFATDNVGLNFSQPGLYTIKLRVGNPVCGKDSIIKTICVNPIPVATFNIDQNIGCTPLNVNTTNTPSANNCGNNTYNWTVTYVPTIGCQPSTANFIFTGGTNANSINPKFQFINPGIYTISLVAISPGGSCSSVLVSKTVTVKGKPVAGITSPSSTCINDPISPTATATCYTSSATYAWSFPGGNPMASSINPPGSVTYTTAGNNTISLDVTNECGTTTVTAPIAINNVSTSVAGPAQNKCGTTVTMAASTPAIGTGQWTRISGPNNATITTATSPTTTITGLIPGVYVFRWTVSNGNCTSTSNVTITISAGASAAVAGANQILCLSTSTILNATSPAIGTGAWTQVSGPNTASITSASTNNTTVSGLIAGTYIFRWTVSFSNCTPNTDDVQVTINDNPSQANAGIDQTICAGGTSLAANLPAIGTGTWTQIGGAAAIISNPNSPTSLVSGLTPGNYKFQWTITNSPCPAKQDTVEINVTQVSTTANAGTNIRACAVNTVNLAANAASVGTGVWSIVSGPAGAVVSNTALPNTSVTGLVTGTYVFRWTITNGNCPPSSDDVQVIIDDNVTIATAGSGQNKCGTVIIMAGNTPVVGTGLWTVVSGPNSPIITVASSPTTSITGLIPGNYIFQWTITNGSCSSFSTVDITIVSGPSAAVAGPDQDLCLNTSATLTATVPVIGTGTWTQMSGPNSSTIVNPTNNSTTVNGLIPGTYIFKWTVTFSNCTPNTSNVQVIIRDNPTIANAGIDQTICAATTSFTANTPTVGNGIWTQISGPGTANIVSASSPTSIVSALVPGTYQFKWTIANLPCPASQDTVNINVTQFATTANAGTDIGLCAASTVTLAGNAPTVGTGVWSIVNGPPGASIANAALSNTSVTGLVIGIYTFRWTITNGNCPPSNDDVQVIVYDNPTAANAGIDQTICAASTSFSANAPVIGTGKWNQIGGPNTAIITDDTLPLSAVSGLIPGIYNFVWTIANGTCAAIKDTVQINVSAIATTANAGPDSTYCALSTISLTGNLPTVGTGVWSNVSGPNTPTITIATANNTTVTGLIPGTYIFRWTITSGVCPPNKDDVEIVILNSLQNNITAPIDTTCAGQSVSIVGAIPTGGNGSYIYQWEQSPDGINWVDIAGETGQSYTGVLNTTTYFRRNVTSLPCEGFSNVIKIFVQPGISNNSISADDSICINTQSPPITGATPSGGDGIYFYQWQQSIDAGVTWTNIVAANDINYNPGILIQTTKYRRLVSTGLCNGPQSNASNIVTITINPDSKAVFTASKDTACAPFDLATVINASALPDSNGRYDWYANGVLFGSNTTGVFPGYVITNPGTVVDIKLITISQFGCKPDTMQMQFVTVITAVASFTKNISGGCGPLNVSFNNTSNIINNGIQFFWDFGNGITSQLAQPGTVTFTQSPFYNDTTYQISLKAYNGCDTTIWRDSVKIRSNPKANFGLLATRGCSPFPVQITNNSLGVPNSYYWDFGNGHTDTTFTNGILNYTYNIGNATDTFPIRLIAKNECTSDTQTINIIIAPNFIRPQVTINGSDLFGCAPHAVVFNNASIGATNFIWDYGDGSAPDTTNNSQFVVVHSFNNAGTFTISIKMTNGCSDTTVFKQVTVYAKPIAAFTTDKTLYCAGDTVRIANTSQNVTNYQWFWGDGQTGGSSDSVHVFTVAGNYTILLRAERNNSTGVVCFDTLVRSISVLGRPDKTVQSNIATARCTPFTLTAAAPGIINEAVTWTIVDTTVSPSAIIKRDSISINYTFNNPGTFSVKMVAENIAGCKDSTVSTFTLLGSPIAAFTPTNIAVCSLDTTVSYLNTSTYNDNGPLRYNWLVDGVLLGILGNFTHRYTTPANTILPSIFTTQLIATNTVGCSSTATATLQMNPKAIPQFSIANPNACIPFVANIINTSQYTTSYQWLLNGVLVDNTANPTILITQPAVQDTIRLIADNLYGCGTVTKDLVFTSRAMPDARFTLSDTLSCTGSLSTSTINMSVNATNSIWDWGDATPRSLLRNTSHLYNSVGQYQVTLIVGDGTCADTASSYVRIDNKPVADFSANTTLSCDTARVLFTNLSTGATSYLWDFGDGTTSNATDPIKNFPPSINPYNIKLVAIGNLGCSASIIKPNYILAQQLPPGDFTVLPRDRITIPDYTFTFNNLTPNGSNYTYQWDLGDFNFASTRDVTHKYLDTGYYNVKLFVLDSRTNCIDSTIKVVRIDGYPGYLYVPNAFYPNSIRSEFQTFKPLGKGLETYTLQVFDGWGKLLFQTSKLNPDGSPQEAWDGRYKGVLMQQDAYVWKISAKFRSGKLWDGMAYNGKKPETFGTLTLFY